MAQVHPPEHRTHPQTTTAISRPRGEPALLAAANTNVQIEVNRVEEREEGGWWAGRLDGKLGWFPSSFCTIETASGAAGGGGRGRGGWGGRRGRGVGGRVALVLAPAEQREE